LSWINDLQLENQADYLISENARLRTVIASMEQSRSWKLTRPLRSLAKRTRSYQRKRNHELARKKELVITQSPLERYSQVVSPVKCLIPNVCGVAHIYYTDLADEIVDAFMRCGILQSVVITSPTPTDELIQKAVERLKKERPKLKISVLPQKNIGRDIFPFLQALQHNYVRNCDVFLKIHTKKSLHLDEHKGRRWRTQLLSSLCKDPVQTSQVAVALHNSDEAWLAFPKAFAAGNESWGKNRKSVKALAGLLDIHIHKALIFPAGSMFWGKSDLLTQLRKLNLPEHEFEICQDQLDGTLPHAVERLFGVITTGKRKACWLLRGTYDTQG